MILAPPGLLKNAQKSLYVTILAEIFHMHVKKSSSGLIYRGNKTTTKNKKVYEQNL